MSRKVIAERARTAPDAPALADDSVTLTWSRFADQVERVAGVLLGLAPGAGERVAVIGENTTATLVAHAAGLLAGVGTVATSRQLTAREMADQFADAGVVAAVTGPTGREAAVRAGAELGLRAVAVQGSRAGQADGPVVAWDDWCSAPVRPVPDGRPARPPLVYTSGTTGRARGTEVRWADPRDRTAADYLTAISAGSNFPDGPHLVVGPLQHNGPLTALRHLVSGQPVVVLGRFDAQRCLSRIDEWRVTSSVMVPTHFQRLLALPEAERARHDVSSLRLVAHTGSACPPDVKRAMIEWFGPVLMESYGASEVGTVARIDSREWLAHPGSVGRAVPPFEAVVVNQDARPLPRGEIGRLAFRAPDGHGVRYHADEAKTRAAYLAPGLFTLGDIGYVDEDGYIHITDRSADMVVSGGVNLYPAECEAVLAQHPGVADVAVIGVPDPDMGEALRALVVPSDPALSPTALDAHCRERLAAYKCPRTYEFVEELPRNAMGKLDKRALRRPYWASERTIAG
ncbi:AMP-binding protein [Actinomadura sp. 6N118]|uniref:AMP-binding protein n=1 Tax=Actinomadura sp. 6N118 TaxID=3375151 RepID=UPI00379BCFD1